MKGNSTMLGISYTNYFLPEEYVSFDKILEKDDRFLLPDSYNSLSNYYEAFRTESGLDKITVGIKEKGVEVFTQLLSNYFNSKNIDSGDVAGLVYTDPVPFNSVTNDNISVPHYLIEKFNLENATMGIVQQQCTGFILSIALANGLLKDGQHLLILSSNYISEMKNRNLNFTFMGDGAGLTSVTKGSFNWEIVDLKTCSLGRNTYSKYHNKDIKIDRMEIIKRGVGLISNILENNNLKITDIYRIIPQNINHFIYSNIYARLLGISSDKLFLENLSHGGHIGDVDLIRNLCDFEKNNIPGDSYILLYGLGTNGLDMTYGSVLLKYTEL